MERLTGKYKGCDCLVKQDDGSVTERFCSLVCNEFQENCPFKKLADKLARYEDLEELGKLVELPCKVGDTVYQLMINMDKSDIKTKKIFYDIYEATVTKYIQDSFYLMFCTKTNVGNYQNELTINAFGETVFLTKEEAEQKVSQL